MNENGSALVLLSGGQDSTTCLAWAIREFAWVEALTVLYGQRHAVEEKASRIVSRRLKVPHRVIGVPGMGEALGGALTGAGDLSAPHPTVKGAIVANVPNRNLILLSLAHSLAQKDHVGTIIVGSTQADRRLYPDCRASFLARAERLLNYSSGGTDIRIAAPLGRLVKAGVFRLADELGILALVLKETVTCYNGQTWTSWEWGRGCGACPACEVRAEGWARFKAGK
jgi:7-cyano-7-deazaguanine synthase